MRVDDNSHKSQLLSTLILVWPGLKLQTYSKIQCMKAVLRRCFYKRLKVLVQSLMYLGSSFHIFGAAALRDLSPHVDSDLPLGDSNIKLSFERKLYLVTSLIVIISLIYCEVRP